MAKRAAAKKPKTTAAASAAASREADKPTDTLAPSGAPSDALGSHGSIQSSEPPLESASAPLASSASLPAACPMCGQLAPDGGFLYTCLRCAETGYPCCVPNAVDPCVRCQAKEAA